MMFELVRVDLVLHCGMTIFPGRLCVNDNSTAGAPLGLKESATRLCLLLFALNKPLLME